MWPSAVRRSMASVFRRWFCLATLALSNPGQLQARTLFSDDPHVTTEAPAGFRRALTDEDMADIYRNNLEADFKPWADRNFSVRNLYDMIANLRKRHNPGPYTSVIVVKGGLVHDIPLEDGYSGNTVAKNRVKALVEGLRNSSAAGFRYPDSVFLISMRDQPFCGSHGRGCKVPVFAIIKRWDFDRNTSGEHDVLLPQFVHVFDYLVFYPWEKKYDRALMRASIKSRMPRNSTRQWLAELQQSSTEGAELLDAGITSNEHKDFKTKQVNPISMAEHARWKYLLATDGITASSRFGKLLGINSVVLKDVSPWIEYYYRSLTPGLHYVPYTKDNVLEVLRGLQSDQPRSRRVSQAGQQFAFSFLSQHCKALYVRRAVATYNGLFTDMEDFMAGLMMDGGGSSRSNNGSSRGGGTATSESAKGSGSAGGEGTHRRHEAHHQAHHQNMGLTMEGLLSQMATYVEGASRVAASGGSSGAEVPKTQT